MKEKTKYIIITIAFLVLIVVNAILTISSMSYVISFIVGGCLGSLLGNYLADIKFINHMNEKIETPEDRTAIRDMIKDGITPLRESQVFTPEELDELYAKDDPDEPYWSKY